MNLSSVKINSLKIKVVFLVVSLVVSLVVLSFFDYLAEFKINYRQRKIEEKDAKKETAFVDCLLVNSNGYICGWNFHFDYAGQRIVFAIGSLCTNFIIWLFKDYS